MGAVQERPGRGQQPSKRSRDVKGAKDPFAFYYYSSSRLRFSLILSWTQLSPLLLLMMQILASITSMLGNWDAVMQNKKKWASFFSCGSVERDGHSHLQVYCAVFSCC